MYEDIDLEFSYKFNITKTARYYFAGNDKEFLNIICNKTLSLFKFDVELFNEKEYMRIMENKNDSTSKKQYFLKTLSNKYSIPNSDEYNCYYFNISNKELDNLI